MQVDAEVQVSVGLDGESRVLKENAFPDVAADDVEADVARDAGFLRGLNVLGLFDRLGAGVGGGACEARRCECSQRDGVTCVHGVFSGGVFGFLLCCLSARFGL